MGFGFRHVRRVGIVLAISNALIFLIGALLISQTYLLCDLRSLLPFAAVSLAAAIRIIAMFQTAVAQQSAATLILDDEDSSSTTDRLLLRFHRRVRSLILFVISIYIPR